MGHAAGQLAHGLQLLGLTQGLLGLLKFRGALLDAALQIGLGAGQHIAGGDDFVDVRGRTNPAGNEALFAAGECPGQPPVIAPVLRPQSELDRIVAPVGDAGGPGGIGGRSVVLVDERRPPFADAQGVGVTGIFRPARTGVVEQAVGGGGPDKARHGLRHGAKPGLAFAQGGLGLAKFGDVGVDADPFAHLPVGACQRDGADGEPPPSNVRPANPMLKDVDASFGDRGVPGHNTRASVIRVHRVGPAVSLVLLRCLARQGRPAGLYALHLARGVVGPQHALDGVDGGAESTLALAQALLGLPALIDVDDRAHVTQPCAVRVEAGRCCVDGQAVHPVGPPQPVFRTEGRTDGVGAHEIRFRPRAVVRMHGVQPAKALGGLFRLAGELVPAAVQVGAVALRVGHPHHHGCVVGHVAEAAFALAHGPLREDLAGGFLTSAEHSTDRARFVAHGRVGERVPGVLGEAVTLHDEVQVLHECGLAGHGGFDERYEVVPDFRPDLLERPA